MSRAAGARGGPDWRWEARADAGGYRRVAGIDEVGRGCLAGPVVAAAVVFEGRPRLEGLRDSKRLSARGRERWAEILRREAAAWAIGEAAAVEVDELNVLEATRLAMTRAVGALALRPDLLLIDAVRLPRVAVSQWALVRGDERSLSIAAASVLAKVHRDRFMSRIDPAYPQYRFARNKGYGTPEHREAVRLCGPCPLHRLSFQGVVSR